MKIFINAASCISPQETFNGKLFSANAKEYCVDILRVIEPDYNSIFDAKQLRRMSRIVRTGLAAAISCLKESSKENVHAIITGTAYGCMEDSENFLKKIVEQDEQMLSPTAFIQSTHNTVGAQIALFLKCYNYNNTFVHRGFSFEHALIDALLLLKENQANNILAGSADELTEFTFSILQRFGLYKQTPVSNFSLYSSNTKGSIAGEGTAVFLLTNEPSLSNYAELVSVETFYKPADVTEAQQRIERFLSAQNITTNDIDLIIAGKNGDTKHDKWFDEINASVFKNIPVINYKHLCGEYPTSSSFALWLAANIIKQKKLPPCLNNENISAKNFQRILIYNNYENKYHSLMLIAA